ncbi:MAG: hypothetical protein LBI39_01430 [Puniceicoccales bacterium]|nr:hypothetical protein [Puniceicoccales bacterium]
MVGKLFRKIFAYLLLPMLFAAGCSECNPDDSQLPWARPGKWEGNSFMGAKTRP